GTIATMWREKPGFKIGAVVAAVIVVFGAITLLGGGSDEKPAQSMMPSGNEISAPPGTEEASPAYIEAIKEQNEARTEQAQREGISAIPTPIEPPVGVIAMPQDSAGAEDPLQRWRKLQ